MPNYLGKIALLVILLIFFQSCTSGSHFPWCFEVTQTWRANYRSARVFIPRETMGIEYIRGPSGIRMYLNLMICPVAACDSRAFFTYMINSTKYQGEAYVMEGGQRLLVCGRDRVILTNALMNGEQVQIMIGMYNDLFESANFPFLFEWLQSLSLPS